MDQMETERKMEMDIEMEMETDLGGGERKVERGGYRHAYGLSSHISAVYMQNLFLHSRVNTKGTAPAHQKSQRMI